MEQHQTTEGRQGRQKRNLGRKPKRTKRQKENQELREECVSKTWWASEFNAKRQNMMKTEKNDHFREFYFASRNIKALTDKENGNEMGRDS